MFFVASTACFSQSDFREGYYISWENDTTHGLIDYRGEIKNSKLCTFKKNTSADELKLPPEDIQAYRFDDSKYYISKKINTSRGEEQVFVEFLVDGIANLYFYRDIDNYLYLVEKENGELLELSNETETIYEEGKKEIIRNSNSYIRLLKVSFADCMEIQPEINRANLTHKSLINITTKYHGYVCDDQECLVYEKKLPAIKLQIAPEVGVMVSNLDFNGGFYSRFSFDQIINPSFGMLLDIHLPRVSQRLSLQLEVLYSKSDFYGIYNGYYELYIKNGMLQPSLGVKYNFPKGKVRPSLAVGVASNSLLNTDIKAVVSNDPSNPDQEHNLDDINMTSSLYGAFVQLGCNYHLLKNFEMFSYIKYSRCAGSTQSVDGTIKTMINSMNFSLGFYL